jgi:hypothetical protein
MGWQSFPKQAKGFDMRKLSLILAVLLFPLAAWADSPGEVTSVSPTQFTFGVLEQFLTINGTGLGTGLEDGSYTTVKFNGAGVSVDVVATFTSPTKLIVAVPEDVLLKLGRCNVHVFVTDADGKTRNVGLGFFEVVLGPPPPPQAPIILGPDVITAEAEGPSGAVVTYAVVVQSVVDPNLEAVCTPASGTFFPLGVSTVHCTATDTNGTGTLDIEVIVSDTTPPELTLPADITTTNPVVTFTATATDTVDGAITPVCTPASGSTFEVGTTTVVSCTATDASLNETTGTFNVTVLADTTPPAVLRISASPSVLSPPNHEMVEVTVTVEATDDIDPSPVSQIVSVTSNQAIDGTGDGDQSPDWDFSGLTAHLRAERASGEDRVYTITVVTSDATGNTTSSTVTVTANNSNISLSPFRQ